MEENKTRPKRVILYPRVSSLSQLNSGDSIDSQIRRLTEFSKNRGYEIIDIYTDSGKSASIDEDSLKQELIEHRFINNFKLNKRPAFQRLLREAKTGKFDAIIFFKWDRYSRDIAFADLTTRYFNKHKILLIPSDDSEDPFVSSIMGVINKQEIEKMKERVRLTRTNQFEKGIITGRCPIGYKPIFKNKRDRRGITEIVPDPKKVDMVKDIFFMTAQGKKYREICNKYKLKPQSYYNLIKNKVYIGIITFEGKEKKGIHEPIISEELFYKINPQLKENGK